jgi:CheY-like chemotaxis protein
MAKTILVVDDERSIVELLKRVFERKGHSVYAAYNGKEGLDIVKESLDKVNQKYKSIDHIFSDTRMPFMDGLEFMAKCREQEGYTGPITQMHGLEINQPGYDSKSKHATNYVTKPFDINHMVELVENN